MKTNQVTSRQSIVFVDEVGESDRQNPAVGDVVTVDCTSRETLQTDVFENDDARWQQVDRSLALGVDKVDVGAVLQK